MILKLKDGRNVDLKWNYEVLEYLDEYETNDGFGISQINKDIKKGKNKIKIVNNFIYALLRAVIDEPLTYRETIKLVDMNDYEKVFNFIAKEANKLDEVKKKKSNITNQNHKRKR